MKPKDTITQLHEFLKAGNNQAAQIFVNGTFYMVVPYSENKKINFPTQAEADKFIQTLK